MDQKKIIALPETVIDTKSDLVEAMSTTVTAELKIFSDIVKQNNIGMVFSQVPSDSNQSNARRR